MRTGTAFRLLGRATSSCYLCVCVCVCVCCLIMLLSRARISGPATCRGGLTYDLKLLPDTQFKKLVSRNCIDGFAASGVGLTWKLGFCCFQLVYGKSCMLQGFPRCRHYYKFNMGRVASRPCSVIVRVFSVPNISNKFLHFGNTT